MSTREDLEAALRARPDDSTLLVYADLLQAQGDPRGELIALDLRPPEQSTNGLETRRGQLLAAWLGDDVDVQFDAGAQLWHAGELDATYATFDCGFIDVFVDDQGDDAMLAQLLHGPAGDHLRRVSLSGSTELLSVMLSHLAVKPRPWLQHLALSRPHSSSMLVDPGLGEKLTVATPHLEVLDLLGINLFDRFAHPNVRELGITGFESIDLVGGAPFAALHAIDFAFDGDRPTPRGLFAPSRVPALRRLCCTREEPGRRLFEELGSLAVAAQITQLEISSIRSPRDHALVQAGIDRMPMLRELSIARAYAMYGRVEEFRHPWARVKVAPPSPWPPREALDQLLVIDGFSADLAELVDVLEEQYEDLPEPHRSTWYRFWTTIDSLQGEQAFNAADLESALGALVLPPHVAALRDHLRARITQRRQNFFAIMSWL
ncbi:MAG: TIGR02996 domain-containing protein [Myxococcota bacterium]|nr:TIGR02996 domain-containing protein [Myxococcota bacterium]